MTWQCDPFQYFENKNIEIRDFVNTGMFKVYVANI